MPLRVRVTTAQNGADALRWLADYCALARLFDAKLTVESSTDTAVVVALQFPGKDSGEKFLGFVGPLIGEQLTGDEGPLLKVEGS